MTQDTKEKKEPNLFEKFRFQISSKDLRALLNMLDRPVQKNPRPGKLMIGPTILNLGRNG